MCTSNNMEGLNIAPANQNNGKTQASNVAEGGTGNLWVTPAATPTATATPTQVSEMASIATLQGYNSTGSQAYATALPNYGPSYNSQTAARAITAGTLIASDKATEAAVKEAGPESLALDDMAFAVGSGLILLEAHNKGKQAKAKGVMIRNDLAYRATIAKNREGLENLQLRDTLDQINTKALKTRSSFQAAKGESLGGATYNAMLADFRRNELNMRERVVDQVTQNRIQVRENLMVSYTKALRDIEILKDSVPTYAEVALRIAVEAVSAYAGAPV